jgi:hypothetical protein
LLDCLRALDGLKVVPSTYHLDSLTTFWFLAHSKQQSITKLSLQTIAQAYKSPEVVREKLLDKLTPLTNAPSFLAAGPINVGRESLIGLFKPSGLAGSVVLAFCRHRTLRLRWVEGCNRSPAVPTPSGGLLG